MKFMRHVDKVSLPGLLDSGDPDITELGKVQARVAGQFLVEYELGIVATSPSRRTLQTYDYAGLADIAPCRLISADFSELDAGTDAGRPIAEVFTPVVESAAIIAGLDLRINPEAQTLAEVGELARAGIDRYRDDIGLIITHGQTFKALVGVTCGLDRPATLAVPFRNGEIVEFDPFNPEEPVSLFYPNDYIDPVTLEVTYPA